MAYEALYTRGRPKNLAQLIGQEHISTALTRAVASGRLSHAYLLVGTRGTGKTSTARLLAKAMNCERVQESFQSENKLLPKEIPCNKCPSCLAFESSPDNVEFDAASNRSVEDVTRLLSTAYLAPLQSRVKTFIIDEVHMLSFEAVNSILKLIEEPPPNVAFFLATTEINKVPITIRSRCQVLNFRLIPRETIAPYLMRLAKRLEVELPENAAQKIARLAEGSMRDAMTYLDQCYAMADKKISLDDVNETLGLISDSDLDEIISAVKEKNRQRVGQAITHAFRSGLAAVSIAESLITRLRDLEFEQLENKNNSEMKLLDEFIDAVRKSVMEMQGSGIPDIILEMTLMKLAAPIESKNFQPNTISIPQKKTSTEIRIENLDEWKKIFYHTGDNLFKNDTMHAAYLKSAVVVDFSDDTFTVGFKVGIVEEIFKNNCLSALEKNLTEEVGRNIKIKTIVDKNLPSAVLERMSGSEKSSLKNAMDAFQTDDVQKISEE